MLRAAVQLLFVALAALPAAAETAVERGAYLVETILACGNCHTPKDPAGQPLRDRNLSGGHAFDTPTFAATAPNITPDRDTGIGGWSDQDIRRALVEGIRPDHARLAGVPLAPVMPAGFYRAMLPEDLDAVIAYLRSVPPIRNRVPDPVYRRPAQHAAYPDAERPYAAADMADPVTRGRYLATIGHCMECHSPMVAGRVDYAHGLGRGGRRFDAALVHGFPADWPGSVAPNVTRHPTAGLGAWTDAEIARAITRGIGRDGRRLQPPMGFAWYAGLRPADVAALVAWLRTVPPLD
ncbi:c-type cytochrome [Stella sp.]|uniref:c-type cytochrome n=1 Tax=Stella sp. TaxID=2912054 RepID=UPI0035B005F6